MKAATINDLKKELLAIPPAQVMELCLRLARYKKENKELISYLLFEAHDEHGYVENVKREMDEDFKSLPNTTPYHTKKSLRKVLRYIAKYSRHTASKQAETEMLLYFCKKINASSIKLHKSSALQNLYNQQVKKINTLVNTLHDDLAYDYRKQLEEIGGDENN